MQNFIDRQFLKSSFLSLLLSSLISALLLYFANNFRQQQQQNYQQQLAQQSVLQENHSSQQQIQQFFKTAYPKYKQLEQQQYFQAQPNGNEYLASLSQVQQQFDLPYFNYRLEKAKPHQLNNRTTQGIQLFRSTINLNLGALHTEPVYQFLQTLTTIFGQNRLHIDICQLKRQLSHNPIMSTDVNIMADCRLSFYYLVLLDS